MQAMFMISFIGFMMAIFGVIAATVSQSAMALKLENIQKVEDIFSSVEFAVNKRLLKQYPDFPSYNTGFNPANLLAAPIDNILTENTQWLPEDLVQDPWRSDFIVHMVSQTMAIGPGVQAPAYAFALVSPGPDRQLQSVVDTTNLTYQGVLAIEAEPDSDDIVHTFATIDSIRENWSTAYEGVEKVVNLLELNYRQQFEQFLPTIDSYYTQPSNQPVIFSGSFGVDDTLLAWVDGLPSGCSGGACQVAPLSTATGGYPAMSADLAQIGADKELNDLVSGFTVQLVQENPCTTPDQCITATVRLTTSAPEWTINYTVNVDGRSLIRQ